MPSFDTPRPITATVEVIVGDVRISAEDRGETLVEVRPSDPDSEADIRATEQTRVEFAAGHLLVKTPKPRRTLGLFGKTGSVDVVIAMPTGSEVHGDAAVAAFHGAGEFGACRIRTATGDVHLDRTGPLEITTASGAIVASSVAGDAQITTATGAIRVGVIAGGAVVKNSNGESRLGTVGGDLRVRTSNGDILVGDARGGVDAATAIGSIRLGAVHRGGVSIRTATGELEVGIAAGTAAYLDLNTQFGKVFNDLDNAGAPGPGEQHVEVRATASFGNIIVRRATAGDAR
jgi:DUF4097 and DUF4098 domain-containing protein YvlB